MLGFQQIHKEEDGYVISILPLINVLKLKTTKKSREEVRTRVGWSWLKPTNHCANKILCL